MSTNVEAAVAPTVAPTVASTVASTIEPDLFTALMSPEARANPYPVLARALATTPVTDTGFGVWFVLGHTDCLTMLRHPATSVDERLATSGSPTPPHGGLPTLIHLDPPDHHRLRRLVQSAFTPKRIDALRERAAELVGEAIARLAELPGDAVVDLVEEVAYPIPLTIICDLLDITEADRPLVREWSTWLARSIDPMVFRTPELNARIEVAQRQFEAHLRRLIADRRLAPGADLFSQLVVTELDGDRLSEDELVGLALLLLVAGHETTVSLVSNGMLALLQHPDQAEVVRAQTTDLRRVVDELLRYDAPVQMTTRVALEPIELSTATIPKGDIAVLLLASANRDPAVFDRPGELDVAAERALAHLAFGNGIHHCLGAALARAEAEVIIAALITRFPAMTLAGEPTLRPTFVLRGREHLMVRLRAVEP